MHGRAPAAARTRLAVDPASAQVLRDMGLTPWVRREAPPAAAGTAQGAPEDSGISQRQWAELETAVAGCTRCALATGRTRTVFGVGSRTARWMIVGEAPGAEEDRRGEPFVGRAGKLLDAMLGALRLGRDQVFITNIVKCRPPGNRDPQSEEAEACWRYLSAQIELIDPALLLAVGRVAAQRLLGLEISVGRLRGQVHEGPGRRPVVVTYHPAYLLRNPPAKRLAWADLKLALATASPYSA